MLAADYGVGGGAAAGGAVFRAAARVSCGSSSSVGAVVVVDSAGSALFTSLEWTGSGQSGYSWREYRLHVDCSSCYVRAPFCRIARANLSNSDLFILNLHTFLCCIFPMNVALLGC